MNDFVMKRRDQAPLMRVVVTNDDGTPFDFTDWVQAKFLMKLPGATLPKVNAVAVIEDAAAGILRYDWTPPDTDVAGTFVAEFQVTSPSGEQRTFPGLEYLQVHIFDDIGQGS